MKEFIKSIVEIIEMFKKFVDAAQRVVVLSNENLLTQKEYLEFIKCCENAKRSLKQISIPTELNYFFHDSDED